MSTAHDLWEEKRSPLWLLQASRSCAQYPATNKIDLAGVYTYLKQFSLDIPQSIHGAAYINSLHPGHKELLSSFADDAVDLQKTFKGAYGIELVHQAKQAWQRDALAKLDPERLSPGVTRNLMVSILIGDVRDMARIEYHFEHGDISAAERQASLSEINTRMDRMGINGTDRLFQSRPELEDLLVKDTTVISVGHFADELATSKQTRAACYNLRRDAMRGFTREGEALANLRQDIISPNFRTRAQQRAQYLNQHVSDLRAPSADIRERYEGCGAVEGNTNAATEQKHTQVLAEIADQVGQKDFRAHDAYVNFLIHDGIAINCLQSKEKFIGDLRTRVDGIIDDTAMVGKARPVHEPLTHETTSPVPSAPTDASGKHSLVVIDGDQASGDLPQQSETPHPVHDSNIEDAIILREELTVPNKEYPPKRGADSEGDQKKEKAEILRNDGKTKDVNVPREPSVSGDRVRGEKSSAGAKVAAIGGAAAALGILLSGRSESTQTEESEGKKRREHGQESSGAGKKIAFGVAATVAVGGAIAWSRKPEFLYKPLQKLVRLFTDGASKGIS